MNSIKRFLAIGLIFLGGLSGFPMVLTRVAEAKASFLLAVEEGGSLAVLSLIDLFPLLWIAMVLIVAMGVLAEYPIRKYRELDDDLEREEEKSLPSDEVDLAVGGLKLLVKGSKRAITVFGHRFVLRKDD